MNDNESIEMIASKLRAIVGEYGETELQGVVILSGDRCLSEIVCGFPHIYCPTLADYKLGNTQNYKMARDFEDFFEE